MKILAIVEHSPWGSSLPVTALRLLRAMADEGLSIEAVYFRGDGVYNAQAGRSGDAGTPALADAWRAFSASSGASLLLCASASRRRLDCEVGPGFHGADTGFHGAGTGFRETGLPEIMECMASCDRMVSF